MLYHPRTVPQKQRTDTAANPHEAPGSGRRQSPECHPSYPSKLRTKKRCRPHTQHTRQGAHAGGAESVLLHCQRVREGTTEHTASRGCVAQTAGRAYSPPPGSRGAHFAPSRPAGPPLQQPKPSTARSARKTGRPPPTIKVAILLRHGGRALASPGRATPAPVEPPTAPPALRSAPPPSAHRRCPGSPPCLMAPIGAGSWSGADAAAGRYGALGEATVGVAAAAPATLPDLWWSGSPRHEPAE